MTAGGTDPLSVRAREIAEVELGRLLDSTPVSHALFERAKKSMPLGVLFTINGTNANDRVVPHFYRAYNAINRER